MVGRYGETMDAKHVAHRTTAVVMTNTFILTTAGHEDNRLTHSLMADRLTSLPTVLDGNC